MNKQASPWTGGNVRKIDFLMSPEKDFPRRPEGPSLRYLLCSTPRCGSNLVGEALRDSGLAGDPHEYLNVRFIEGYRRTMDDPATFDLVQYVKDIEQRRTSPNGVFGIKVHFEHLKSIWGDKTDMILNFLRRFHKFVLLTRRDKIAQAVSLYKARTTQIWSSLDYKFLEADDPRLAVQPEFDAEEIAQALRDVIWMESSWRALLEGNSFPYIELCYEDFAGDYANGAARLLQSLGIEAPPPGPPRISKQGSESDPMIARFRQAIGVDAPGAK